MGRAALPKLFLVHIVASTFQLIADMSIEVFALAGARHGGACLSSQRCRAEMGVNSSYHAH